MRIKPDFRDEMDRLRMDMFSNIKDLKNEEGYKKRVMINGINTAANGMYFQWRIRKRIRTW